MVVESNSILCVYVWDGKEWNHVSGTEEGCNKPGADGDKKGETVEMECNSDGTIQLSGNPNSLLDHKVLTEEEFNSRYEGRGWTYPPTLKGGP